MKRIFQIEKEFLSNIYFATQKFHNFIYGREIKVINDHKPLLGIMKKKISDIASNRLKKLRLKLAKYKINLQYLPGKFLHIADLLSRSFLPENNGSDEWIDEEVHTIITSINISDKKKAEFQKASLDDPVLSQLIQYHFNGWPETKNETADNVKHYFNMQGDLSVEENSVFLNNRLIVPIVFRSYILNLLHESHFGITKTKERARQIVNWPGITHDIENKIGLCAICEKYSKSKTKDTLISHDIPDIPFNKVGCDLCDFKNKSYLTLQDYFTKWLEIVELKNKTTSEVINKLKIIFSTHGIPKTLIADNMPFG